MGLLINDDCKLNTATAKLKINAANFFYNLDFNSRNNLSAVRLSSFKT